MDRQTLAYLIIVALVAVLIAWLAYRRYYGRERSYRRRVAREHLAYKEAMNAKSEQAGPP